ncbi:hypothetical protein SKAU_G00316410 [Synaphobranchus kaupii]|uniref:Zinc finger protein ZFPM1 n=1 Tax=Synaphobranchus kaupii TaxID=118154 RepID=A0A9Q1ESS8_SYNKA|nr:hypothetical protein SKAU_G00316410 [Synaphobranchus kaupii]
MSRRKQTKPRQIKRSLGDLEEGDDHPPDDLSLSEDEGGASDQEDSAEFESSPLQEPQQHGEVSAGPGTPDTSGREEEEKSPPHSSQEEEQEVEPYWDGPDELHLSDVGGARRILARKYLAPDTTWGPYSGLGRSRQQREGQDEKERGLTPINTDTELWLKKLPVTSNHSAANCSIYSQGEELYCKVIKAVPAGDCLLARLPEPTPTETHNAPVKQEELAPPHPEIHLLPQQAGMAAILATAVINKDVFPCKACGIWYRSERNLQAHLQYYCASRKQDPASPPPEHPSEHVCPLAHCSKSCPSASALEIHARAHSGERPFLCLICMSAFTTKANCERHLKVHTDAHSGTCHSCGFVSSTRDILYSHVVTCHMACQPGSHSEGSSPGPGVPPLLLKTGLSEDCGAVLKCQVCGFPADSIVLLQQHVQTHLKVRSPSSSESPEPVSVAPPDPPGANGPPATPCEGSLPDRPPSVRVKEEPHSDLESEALPSRSPSPTTLSLAQVKVEPPSATPSSSPGPQGAACPPPQASEILAKITEMVHTRLRQGHTPTTPADHTPARPVHKGATCFECDITFNNVNNFYVHKRLYCSSRHQHGRGDTPTVIVSQVKEGAESSPPAVSLSSSPAAPAPCSNSETQAGAAAVDGKPAEVKTEGAGLREALCSEGESGGRASEASEGSQSPGGSGEDTDDTSGTFCQACNIRFSRQENYTVHKRFYCASRHQPGSQRPHAGNTGFLPQPVRTRKRKKMYEIHMARSHALASSASTPDSAPPPGLSSTPSPHSEGDGPIDLRKRPRPQEAGQGLQPGAPTPPTTILSDYHKCTACSISFNSIENYLAHKAYYCPVPLQQRPLQPLSKMCILPSPRSGCPDQLEQPPACTQSPAQSPPTPGSKGASPHSTPPSGPLLTCPYCPLAGAIAGDLMDHFRTAHGLVLTRLPCGPPPGSLSPGQSEPSRQTEVPPPRDGPLDAVNGSSSPSPPLLNGSPRLAPPAAPPAAGPGAVSPVPEAMKEAGPNVLRNTPPLAHAQTSPKAAQVSPLQNGTSRYCRLCNIRFSSLSTFVAHKKYYCSSHSAEHVK